MSGSLDRNRIMKLFETLSARLAARGIRGQLYIVGGGAMIVGYGRERTTRDVDARIEYAKDAVLAAAEEIAEEETTKSPERSSGRGGRAGLLDPNEVPGDPGPRRTASVRAARSAKFLELLTRRRPEREYRERSP